jgi:hypothetical protein
MLNKNLYNYIIYMTFLAKNVPAEASAKTSSGFVVTATATASATSEISPEDAFNQAQVIAQSIAQSIAQNNANIEEQTIDINNSPAVTPETITLYYKLTTTGTNATSVNFLNNADTYTGVNNRYMTNADGTYNQDIITYFGYRTPGSVDLGIPALYCETVIIKTPQGDLISGLANYVDGGSGFVTSSPYENFAVTCASGKFAGYKNIKVSYYPDKTRIVTITN